MKVRFQGENDEKNLVDWQTKIEAGEDYHFAFTFDEDEIGFYLNGELIDADTGYADGMTGNEEDLVIGGSTRTRNGEDDNIQWHFDGSIENLEMLDRPLEEIEILFLAENNGNVDSLGALYGDPVAIPEDEEPQDDGEQPTDDDQQDDDTNETGGDDGQNEPVDDNDVDPPADDDNEQPQNDGDDEEEEESGVGAVFAEILNIFLSLFGLGDDEDDDMSPPSSEEIDTSLTEIEDLLNGLFTDPIEDADMASNIEDEEEMVMMM